MEEKVNPRMDFTLSFTSALDNINYILIALKVKVVLVYMKLVVRYWVIFNSCVCI